MKTETQVQIKLQSLESEENLYIQPDGFVLKFFVSCSQSQLRPFKITSSSINLNKTIKIKNIVAQQLQIWLCTTYNKIISVANVPIVPGERQELIQLKLNGIIFAKLKAIISATKTQIQKIVYIEPDQQLLKKVQDPYQKIKRQQEELRRTKQLQQLERAAKAQKKHAVTLTYQNRKDQPFL